MRPSPLQAALSVALIFGAAVARGGEESPRLEEVGAETGFAFHHVNGMTGLRHLVEMTGAGAGWIDFDSDGDLDALLVQGGVLDPDRPSPEPWQGTPHDTLLRNDLVVADGSVQPRFVDWTAAGGLASEGYGMGVATGDVNLDGWPDLLITNFGTDRLWRNRGDGSFEDASADLGTPVEGWSTSASFVDVDADGDPDLYIGRYVDYPLADPITCYAPSSRVDYCGPSAFRGVRDRLLRNRGDGTFEDVSGLFGIDRVAEPALGVVATTAAGETGVQIYVANDGRPNLLWSFDGREAGEEALLAGVAVNRMGEPEAGMGIAAEDFDNDGDEDFLVTHLTAETDTLYVNEGDGLFEDRTLETGLGEGSLAVTSFGVSWIDVDGDGWLDLAVTSGAVRILEEQAARGMSLPLEQPGHLLRNVDGRRLVPFDAAPGLARPGVGRGLAAGDVDNDGDTDLLATYNGGDARLLELSGRPEHGEWLGVRATDLHGAPAAGTVLLWEGPDGSLIRRTVRTDGSYLSARDPRVQWRGLSTDGSLLLRWPDGRRIRWLQPVRGVYATFREAAP
ncbi:MAG: VCBS repeat-containing protein [Thermoanaerobaculia bacterium]